MPIYEYECPKHGIFEQIQSIHDRPLKRCFIELTIESQGIRMKSICGEKIKRLISGGIGVIPNADYLWEPDPTSPKPRAERRGDLKRHEATLVGVPQKDRDRFRGYSRGKGDPLKM
jgi:hypothetical protein